MHKRKWCFFLFAGVLSLPAAPSVRAEALIQIEKVIGGINGDVTAQAIQLRVRSVLIPQVGLKNARLRVRDANGLNPVVVFASFSDVLIPNNVLGDRILIASTNFATQSIPMANPDFTMENLIPESYLAAGTLTYERIDGLEIFWRLSWGGANFTGPTTGSTVNDADGQFGPPFDGVLPFACERALEFQFAADAMSTNNAADYIQSPDTVVFENNAGETVTVVSIPGACCAADECDDMDVCTDDACDFAMGCVSTPNVAPCDDGDVCTTLDECSNGQCMGGPPMVCDDTNVCTNDTCDPAVGCVFAPNMVQCDDGDACTEMDACLNEQCIGGPPLVCDDQNVCTDDSCDSMNGCVFTNNTLACDDLDACTIDDFCIDGSCISGDPLVCDDGVDCTDDVCVDGTCVSTANDTLCPDDGAFCTGREVCDSRLGCLSTGNPCGLGEVCDDVFNNCGPRRLVAVLDGLQSAAGVTGAAFGCAMFDIEPDTNTVTYRITFADLVGGETLAEIRGPAPVGTIGALKHTLPAGNPKVGTWTYDEVDEADVLNGLMYVDILSTGGSPDGEIRGQMVDLVAVLDGMQANTQSSAVGFGTFRINTTANTVDFHIGYDALLSGETVSEIHGPAAHLLSAAPVFTLPPGNPKVGVWQYLETQETDILNGLTYITIASNDSPNGEIRGQITRIVVPIEETQQVPPSGAVGAACGLLSLDENLTLLGLYVQSGGLEGSETGTHIHGFAPTGANAGSLFIMPPGNPKLTIWDFADTDLANVKTGLTYLDSHSTVHSSGAIRGQIEIQEVSFVDQCITGAVEECCDVQPSDGVRDDPCQWCACVNPPMGICDRLPVSFGDMGGSFGNCTPDGFCNLADALHALTCFAGTNVCESINIDAGGAFGACAPDGFCNLADALHALTCFAGTNPCTCAPSPEFASEPRIVGKTRLVATAQRRTVRPGDEVRVRVFMDKALPNFSAFQLQAAVSGGRRGYLELVNIETEHRKDSVFSSADEKFEAFNVERGQAINGLLAGDVATERMSYLATYIYRVSLDARGTFVVDILHDEGAQNQTFLVGADQTDKIEIAGTQAAVITVGFGDVQSIR